MQSELQEQLKQLEQKYQNTLAEFNQSLNRIFGTNYQITSLEGLEIGSGIYSFGGSNSDTKFYFFTNGDFKKEIPLDSLKDSNTLFNWIEKNYKDKNRDGGWWCLLYYSHSFYYNREYFEDIVTETSHDSKTFYLNNGDNLKTIDGFKRQKETNENCYKEVVQLLSDIKHKSNNLRLEKQLLYS